MSDRALPLPKVTGIYSDGARYQDTIKVTMSDGKTVRYRIDPDMPHPSFQAAMKNLERMNRV